MKDSMKHAVNITLNVDTAESLMVLLSHLPQFSITVRDWVIEHGIIPEFEEEICDGILRGLVLDAVR
jgi:hypothetical protein